MTSSDDAKVEAARADVLAFIERLEKAEAESKRAKAEQSQGDVRGRSGGVRHPAMQESPGGGQMSFSTRLPDGREGSEDRPAQTAATSPPADVSPRPRDDRQTHRRRDATAEPGGIAPRVLKVWVDGPDREQSGQPPSEGDATATTAVSAPVANMPVAADSRPSADERGDVSELIAGLEKRVADNPDDEQAKWRLALVRLAFGKSDCSAGKELPASGAGGGLLTKSICTLAAAKRAVEDPVAAEEALASVDALRSELKERAVLEIPTIALCTRVQAFGVYEELPEGFLRANVQNQAIAYFEVANFSSETTADGRFRTLLSDRFEILTPEGDVVWQHAEPQIEDLSRRRREDFFVAQRIVIPPVLDQGAYVLKVTVEDRLAGKQTQSLMDFHVAGGLARPDRR